MKRAIADFRLLNAAPVIEVWNFCDACRKRAYHSRAEAKRTAKRIPSDCHMTPYSCFHGSGWHLGHLPANVRNGTVAKAEYVAQLEARTR